MASVVTFGEAMVLFTPQENGPLRHVDLFRKYVAGAELNVAIGLARLGESAGWVSRLGDDEFGAIVLAALRAEGVDVSHVRIEPERPLRSSSRSAAGWGKPGSITTERARPPAGWRSATFRRTTWREPNTCTCPASLWR